MIVTLMLAAGLGGFADAQDGAKLYATTCAGCHGEKGEGLITAFPALAGRFSDIPKAQGGRAYPVHVLRNGVSGKFKINGVLYDSAMDEYPDMTDADLVAILNYVATSWGNKWPAGMKPYTAAEVKALRGAPMTHQQVLASRPKTLK